MRCRDVGFCRLFSTHLDKNRHFVSINVEGRTIDCHPKKPFCPTVATSRLLDLRFRPTERGDRPSGEQAGKTWGRNLRSIKCSIFVLDSSSHKIVKRPDGICAAKSLISLKPQRRRPYLGDRHEPKGSRHDDNAIACQNLCRPCHAGRSVGICRRK